MVETYKCSFCGESIEPGTGRLFVRKDGALFYFCSTKCRKNYELKRVPRRVTWTEAGRKALGKE
ncbi:50S ribosomal protein L24e [Methanofollis fontis]|uniref:Large ribosomal subunit protein eL24 n=1 Tax=Methanofollis fontis TaxID=2052832 RepID=A0A483CSN9_9EURY|nr:50S ribosomal protein L24e [Methanofollis fontis]TAJ44210.1 50S ribosomal protein L24e [Methanofollis fontis]